MSVQLNCTVLVSPHQRKLTSSLSLPIKSSSGWASWRLLLLLWTWSSPFSIFSWSPWPCPRLGECGWDKKVNTSSCRMSWGSGPSLLSQLLQTCRSEDKSRRIEQERDSDDVGASLKLSFPGLRLHLSNIKDEDQAQNNFNINTKINLPKYTWRTKPQRLMPKFKFNHSEL